MMPWRRLCALLALVVGWALVARVARAQNPPEERTLHATVVLVGAAEDSAQLVRSLADLLRVRGIVARFELRNELKESELSTRQYEIEATVWITFPRTGSVRLVFADYARQLFIVRDLPLAEGLDPSGRELVGQVVESSLLSLGRGVATATRAEAKSALGQYLLGQPSAAPTAPGAASQVSERRAAGRISQRVGLAYALAWDGRALGLEQGFDLFSGLELARPSGAWFAVGALESRFEQLHRGAEFDLSVQANRAWLALGQRESMSAQSSVTAGLGAGLEIAHIRVHAKTAEATAVPSAFHLSPWLRAQAGFEWGGPTLALGCALALDLAVFQTHYDVTDATGTRQTVARPALFRPGASIGVVWR